MKNLSDCKVCRSLGEWWSALTRYNVRKDYDITLGLYADGSAASPECSHHIKGTSRQNLLKLLALFGMVSLILALIRGICSLLSRL